MLQIISHKVCKTFLSSLIKTHLLMRDLNYLNVRYLSTYLLTLFCND